ncbi:MAG: hypothetical protein GTN74_06220 [Proteobacteria bacterium]|nr:hypothetical protein [Pseudomonadota bacterium]
MRVIHQWFERILSIVNQDNYPVLSAVECSNFGSRIRKSDTTILKSNNAVIVRWW